jgi:hypothetical protein
VRPAENGPSRHRPPSVSPSTERQTAAATIEKTPRHDRRRETDHERVRRLQAAVESAREDSPPPREGTSNGGAADCPSARGKRNAAETQGARARGSPSRAYLEGCPPSPRQPQSSGHVTERNSARAGRRGLSSDTEKEQDEDQRQRCAQEPEKNESHDDPPFGVIGCKDRTPPSGVTQLGLQLRSASRDPESGAARKSDPERDSNPDQLPEEAQESVG